MLQNLAIVAGHDSTLDDDDVLALSSLDRLLASFLEGVASSGREGLGVVEREILEEQRCRIGVIRLGKRLGATGAGTKLHPDDWCEAALAQTSVRTDKGVALDGFGNIGSRYAFNADCSCNRATEAEKGATCQTTRLKRLDKRILHRYLHLPIKLAARAPHTKSQRSYDTEPTIEKALYVAEIKRFANNLRAVLSRKRGIVF